LRRRRADPGCAGGFAEARAALWRAAKAEARAPTDNFGMHGILVGAVLLHSRARPPRPSSQFNPGHCF